MLLPAGFALPEPGAPVVITDTTAASSNFAVYHLIQLAHERGIPVSVGLLPHALPAAVLPSAVFFLFLNAVHCLRISCTALF